MGDWGAQPWNNDEAADWFHKFWKKSDFSILIDEIRNFDETKERYDSFRAACYVLQTMGNPYIWPSEHRAGLKELLERSVEILEKMINPPDETWGFLDMWGNDPQVVESVRRQIAELKQRRSEFAS